MLGTASYIFRQRFDVVDYFLIAEICKKFCKTKMDSKAKTDVIDKV